MFGKVLAILLFLIVFLAPSPAGLSPQAQRLAAVTLLMATLWFTQAIPIAATALIPIAAFPLLAIQSANVVAKSYMNQNIMLFLGGFIIALGIEKWGLHRRIALFIISMIGSSLRLIVLGFMLATAFLSMWISNTASTLLMLPIGLAVIGWLSAEVGEDNSSTNNKGSFHSQFAIVLMLAIAYSASIGGFTTLVGTPTNVQFVQIWTDTFPAAPPISTGKWLFALLPLGVVMLLVTWFVLTIRLPAQKGTTQHGRAYFRQQLKALGKPTRAEWLMGAVFLVTAILWITRSKLEMGSFVLIDGWGGWAEKHLLANLKKNVSPRQMKSWIHDSTVAMGMALLMFFIPASKDKNNKTLYLMDWKSAEKLPWGILLLIGGGFAIATGFKETGLSLWLGEYFATIIEHWPLWLIIVAVCLLFTFLTEFTSNIATVATLLPILAGIAVSLKIDPRLLMFPATISASCAFMLPIATPPNAIVFGSEKIPMGSMIRYGLILNFIGVVLISLFTYFILIPQFGISTEELPGWSK